MFKHIPNRIINTEGSTVKETLSYIAIAYFFGIFVRLFMLYHMLPDANLWLDNNVPLPILNPDTGQYAYHARQILSGHFYSLNAPDKLPAYLLASVTFILSAKMDWVIFLLPIFLAAATVIPIILIGNTLRTPKLGFFAALFAMANLDFYLRSHLGYYDTDVLNLFFPLMIIWSMLQIIVKQNQSHLLIGALLFWSFGLWYHSSIAISAALILGFALTTLFFFRNNTLGYQAIFIFFAAIVPLHPLVNLALIVLVYLAFFLLNRQITTTPRLYWLLLLAGSAIVLLKDPSGYYHRALAYFDKPEMLTLNGKNATYYFVNQLAQVSEAVGSNILEPFGYFNRQTSLALLSSIGYILMIFSFRAMLLLLPLFILGYSSYYAGMRFMMFAMPAFSFGLAYIVLLIFKQWEHVGKLGLPIKAIRNFFVICILFYMSDAINTVSKDTRAGFNAQEATALRNFAKQLHPNDTIVAWWDYGWPLWYYTGYANTMIDNGTHGRYDAYIVSRLLMSDSQIFSANAALYFSRLQKEARAEGIPYALQYLVEKNVDLNQTYFALGMPSFKCKPAAGNVYILLKGTMYDIINTIKRSSDFDITSGKFHQSMFRLNDELSDPFSLKKRFAQGKTFTIDNVGGTIIGAGNRTIPLSEIVVSEHHKIRGAKQFKHQSRLSLAIVKDKYAFYMDNALFHSFYIQAYMFDHYDKSRFEKVAETPHMKIFKVLQPAPE